MIDTSNVHWGRLVAAAVAAWIVIFLTDILIHAVILMDAYMVHYEGIARDAEAMPLLPGILKQVAWAVLGAWIYIFGVHPGYPGWLQGIRFGFFVGLFWWIPYALLEYAILPIPPFFIIAWVGLGTLQMTLMGLVIGSIYRTRAQTLLAKEEL